MRNLVGSANKKLDSEKSRSYTTLDKEKALKLYEEIGKVTAVIQKLGYPTRETLYNWLREKRNRKEKKKYPQRINNSPEHPLHPTPELKLETISVALKLKRM